MASDATRPAGIHRRGLPLSHPAALIATWFGSGLLPGAPGSWGSLAALPFAWAIAALLGSPALIPAAAALFLLGWWAAAAMCRASGEHDPGAIVVDEVVGQWLALALVPPSALAYGLGFLLFRIADIVKPWPASWADAKLGGGLGVMLDDAIAGVYAGLALFALLRLAGA